MNIVNAVQFALMVGDYLGRLLKIRVRIRGAFIDVYHYLPQLPGSTDFYA